jgi:hypothetical protein
VIGVFIEFRGYGVGAREVTVDVARVTHFRSVDYNGVAGTMLFMDSGAEVCVDGYSWDVSKKIREALASTEARRESR